MTTIDYRINGARVGGTYLNMFHLRERDTDRKAKLPRGDFIRRLKEIIPEFIICVTYDLCFYFTFNISNIKDINRKLSVFPYNKIYNS